VIGAGHHSRTHHLPALAQFRRLQPDAVALAAIADVDLAVAHEAKAVFGFASAYTDMEEMLAREKPDAALALTPTELNASTTIHLARHGLPVLMEKPLGVTIDEARRLVTTLHDLNAHVMVSMNRRFDPFLRAALKWIGPRPIRHVKATMARHSRLESHFVEHTGLHVVDIVRAIAGDVSSCDALRQKSPAGDWFEARLAFANGATGLVELKPKAGTTSEALEISGEGFRVEVCSAEFDRGGWRAWQNGLLESEEWLAPGTSMHFANGTLAETEAFFRSLLTEEPFRPAPADVLPSMELCHVIDEAPEWDRRNVP
jgi:predicted dehydrogenase